MANTLTKPALQGWWPARPPGFGAALFDLNARIERRSGSAARRFNFRQFRFFEIDRLARWRNSASIDIDALGFGRAVASCAEPNVAAKWLDRFCPSLDREVVDQLLEEAGRSPPRFTAGQLGE